MDSTFSIDTLLEKASELGQLLRETEEYSEYSRLQKEADDDEYASSLLKNYEEEVAHIQEYRKKSMEPPKHELQRLEEMTRSLQSNDLLAQYLAAREKYARLLEEVQRELSA